MERRAARFPVPQKQASRTMTLKQTGSTYISTRLRIGTPLARPSRAPTRCTLASAAVAAGRAPPRRRPPREPRVTAPTGAPVVAVATRHWHAAPAHRPAPWPRRLPRPPRPPRRGASPRRGAVATVGVVAGAVLVGDLVGRRRSWPRAAAHCLWFCLVLVVARVVFAALTLSYRKQRHTKTYSRRCSRRSAPETGCCGSVALMCGQTDSRPRRVRTAPAHPPGSVSRPATPADSVGRMHLQ